MKQHEERVNEKSNAKAVKALERKGKTRQAEALAKKVGLR
jgi:hypothetical protein